MSLPKYRDYKASGVAWLGATPSHWTTTRLKFLLTGMGSGGTPDTDNAEFWAQNETGTPWVAIGDLSDRAVVRETAKALTAEGIASKGLKVWPAGTLLFSMYASLGHTAVLATPAATNQAILALLPADEVNQRFLYRWLEFLKPKLREHASSNTQDNLNAEKVGNLLALHPPLQEQIAIASFLDRETAKIDALIAEQEKLITLLAEKHQATISHAVTRGLNPHVPMKDSGSVWLGQIPQHWDVVPLMHLTPRSRPIMYGIVLPGPDVDDGIPIVKGGDVKPPRLKLELLNRTTADIEAPYARARLRPMDIVYSIRGTIGDAEMVPHELLDANITQDVARISPESGIQPRWLLHVMKSKPVFVQLEQRSLGAAVRGINIFELKRARVPVPPAAERDAIAAFLEVETAKLEALAAEAKRAIGLLKERRSALIAAAVTGQIDVRNVVKPPAEVVALAA